jgi:hypothetical protein
MTDTAETLLWLVFSAPVEGHEDEFNDWYDEVHLPEVQAVPGIRSAQRLVLGPERRPLGDNEPLPRYLAIYEIDGDPEDVFAEIARRQESGEMTTSTTIDRPAIVQAVWHPRAPKLG